LIDLISWPRLDDAGGLSLTASNHAAFHRSPSLTSHTPCPETFAGVVAVFAGIVSMEASMTPQLAIHSIATSDPGTGLRDLLIDRAATVFAPEYLTPLLDLEDAPSRNAAADVLVQSGDAAVAALREVVLGGPERAALMAVQVLTRIGSRKAAKALSATLDTAKDVIVLRAVLEAVALLQARSRGGRR